jgi:riboflavin synthase
MFTGIIEECGQVQALQMIGSVLKLSIKADKVCHEVQIGDSISVDGVCLTVVGLKEKVLSFDVIRQTSGLTTLKNLKYGDFVNLERALKIGDRLGGHFVTGHIDCLGVVRSKKQLRGNWEIGVGIPAAFLKFVLKKGSVAIDGISLTIADVKCGTLFVCVIPHTLKMTTLGRKTVGKKVNIELDILAKRSAL